MSLVNENMENDDKLRRTMTENEEMTTYDDEPCHVSTHNRWIPTSHNWNGAVEWRQVYDRTVESDMPSQTESVPRNGRCGDTWLVTLPSGYERSRGLGVIPSETPVSFSIRHVEDIPTWDLARPSMRFWRSRPGLREARSSPLLLVRSSEGDELQPCSSVCGQLHRGSLPGCNSGDRKFLPLRTAELWAKISGKMV